ncbi:MAG: Gfo/Idh/MocA family oxidoreductase [Bryobacterales bacterium]|nr:Gfo/Idh/MocA family oxidoreductase [Bryobacterales bacterium]
MLPSSSTSRRGFVGALSAASYQRVMGANERLQVACIGCGIIAGHHLRHLKAAPDVDLAAMCDAYLPRAEKYVAEFNPRAKACQDFRRVLEDKNIQAVFICTPPHWHALMTILACAAGKDVYVEKPMTVFVREGRWVMEAVRRYNRVVQVGTQQRSLPHYQRAATDLLRGYLGKISSIRSGAVRNVAPGWGKPSDSPPPPGLDWELFLGPAPRHPHNSNRGMNNFHLQTARWFWDTDGGQQTNMGVHEMDIVLWALQAKGPTAVVSFGGRRILDDNCEVPDTQDSLFSFPGGATAVFSYREASVGGQTIPVLWFFGSKGGMNLSREGFDIYPDSRNPEGELPGSSPRAKLEPWIEPLKMRPESSVYGGMDLHERNFLDCVKSRRQPNATVENGHYAAASCHLANLSLRLGGRALRWDADREDFLGDPEASAMLVRPYSPPWDRELRALHLG